MISREEVLKLLEYDEFTGVFRWRVRPTNSVKAGSVAGCIMVTEKGKSYTYITITGRRYGAHRLAWLLISGQFPNDEIDHIDGNGINNAAANLRAVTHSENGKNHRKPVNNTSGAMGVHWYRTRAKWQAFIVFNGKKKHLGYFESFDAAVAARKEAEKLYGFSPNHGETRPL